MKFHEDTLNGFQVTERTRFCHWNCYLQSSKGHNSKIYIQELWFLHSAHRLMFDAPWGYLERFSSYRADTILWRTDRRTGDHGKNSELRIVNRELRIVNRESWTPNREPWTLNLELPSPTLPSPPCACVPTLSACPCAPSLPPISLSPLALPLSLLSPVPVSLSLPLSLSLSLSLFPSFPSSFPPPLSLSVSLRTVNCESWTVNREPWTTNREPWTANREPWTVNREPWTANCEPWTANREPWTTNRQPWANLTVVSPTLK